MTLDLQKIWLRMKSYVSVVPVNYSWRKAYSDNYFPSMAFPYTSCNVSSRKVILKGKQPRTSM